MRPFSIGAAVVTLLACTGPAPALDIAVSANDGKARIDDGVVTAIPHPPPDTVTLIDLAANPSKVLGSVNAPVSVVGPPQSVAVARDGSFALVASSMKAGPADPAKLVPDDRVSVIDLTRLPPVVTATLTAGLGASGVSINRTGTLALVANRSEGTVSPFRISGKDLAPLPKLKLGDAKSGPSHVVFTPDGRHALVTRDGDNRVSWLQVDGDTVTHAGRDIIAGVRPYSLDISSKGDIAVNGNQGGGGGDADTVSVIDLQLDPPRVVNTVSVGQTPECVVLSPDGAYLAVNVINGSHKPKSSPFYNDFGLLKIYAVEGKDLRYVTEAKVGHWGQGVAWGRDGRTLLYQATAEHEIQVLSFDGSQLTPTGSIPIEAGPVGLRTPDR
jgi:DNA-binding beta-propeller fold protein YncE